MNCPYCQSAQTRALAKTTDLGYVVYRCQGWGTIYRNSDSDLFVRGLNWNVFEWHWHYRWLDTVWFDHNPAAVLAS
jgi:hypothetical protein